MSGSRPTARLLFMWKSNQKHTNDAFDPKEIRFDNIPTKLRLVASLILYIVQYGIIDSGSAGRFSPHKSGWSMYKFIITDYFQLTLEKS